MTKKKVLAKPVKKVDFVQGAKLMRAKRRAVTVAQKAAAAALVAAAKAAVAVTALAAWDAENPPLVQTPGSSSGV